jgi:hypothetical protein
MAEKKFPMPIGPLPVNRGERPSIFRVIGITRIFITKKTRSGTKSFYPGITPSRQSRPAGNRIIKKISATDLTLGMVVTQLDRSWLA